MTSANYQASLYPKTMGGPAKKAKIDTILTVTIPDLGEPTAVDRQFEVIASWCPCAARVIVHSNSKPPAMPDGFRLNPTKSSSPTVSDVFRGYAVQIPGAEIFGIAFPDVSFNPNQSEFFAHVEKEGLNRTWAASFTNGKSDIPIGFVIAAPILPYILNDLPPNLTFDGESWALWFHYWMNQYVVGGKYFNGDKFKIITPIKPKKKDK